MSTISAGTSAGTALVNSGDTTGALVLQTNGTTTAVTIGTNQVVTLAQPLPVASGGTGGSATPTAGGIVYGTGTVQAVTAAGTSGQVLQSNGASAPSWVSLAGGITLGTPVDTTSGTAVDYTGIPAGTKRITVNFSSVSTNGTTQIAIQLGDSGGIEESGYTSLMTRLADGSNVSSTTTSNGFSIYSTVASAVLSGSVVINLENSTTFTWCASGIVGNTASLLAQAVVSGRKSLSAELDRIRIAAGGDTFDAGQINISYE
jgi:hypothetical protein